MAGDVQQQPIPAGRRPRRAPAEGVPRIAESDRPDPAELARVRQQSRRRWVPVVRLR